MVVVNGGVSLPNHNISLVLVSSSRKKIKDIIIFVGFGLMLKWLPPQLSPYTLALKLSSDATMNDHRQG